MYKHIKLLARPSKDPAYMEVAFVHMTHYGDDFGERYLLDETDEESEVFASEFIHKGVRLVSCIARYHVESVDRKGREISLTEGEDNTEQIGTDIYMEVPNEEAVLNKSFRVNTEHWPRCKAAIEAYNEYYKE